MKKQKFLIKKRLLLFGSIFTIFVIGLVLVLVSFKNNIVFFYSPTELQTCHDCLNKKIKIGGIVLKDSIVKRRDNFKTEFVITDQVHEVAVIFTGIAPNLFKEEQGVVAEGYLRGNVFISDMIFAKHDENYMPPEVAGALERAKDAQKNEIK